MLDGLEGRIVEVGAGTGLNFAHYPTSVTEVVAVEPEPRVRGLASTAAPRASVLVTVVDGSADSLPLEDDSCDAAVCSLVRCSVPDQARALAEVRRVRRRGGELRFYESVLDDDPRMARFQRRPKRRAPERAARWSADLVLLADLPDKFVADPDRYRATNNTRWVRQVRPAECSSTTTCSPGDGSATDTSTPTPRLAPGFS